MTAIKCKAIRSTAHMKNARDYVEDERQLDSWTLNITCPEKWEQEMSMARTAYGHDASGREGTRPTYAFHMVIAFNPDECIQHGGPIGPGEAMAYAERYISESFPHCQAKMTLHEEGGGRYAVHAIVNRTVLDSGNRFNRDASARWAEHQRQAQLDRSYGLIDHMERGGHYARAKGRDGLSKPVREIVSSGRDSWVAETVASIAEAASQEATLSDFARCLASKGIATGELDGRRWYVAKGHEQRAISAENFTAYGIGTDQVRSRFGYMPTEGSLLSQQRAFQRRQELAADRMTAAARPLSRDERSAARAFARQQRHVRLLRTRALLTSERFRQNSSWEKGTENQPRLRDLKPSELAILTPKQRHDYEIVRTAEREADKRIWKENRDKRVACKRASGPRQSLPPHQQEGTALGQTQNREASFGR